VPHAALGAEMLEAAAIATSSGMVVGFLGATVYIRVRLGGSVPLASALRIAAAAAAAVVVGHFLPGHGKIAGLAVTALVAVVYLGLLVALGEFGPDDRAKLKRVLRR
jgi:hypothetical protein